MKNIHLLPTDKPSRLYKSEVTGELEILSSYNINVDGNGKNIYITSDEEIKDGDWMIRGNEQPTLVTPNFFWDFGVRYYKIILTTDQDLIGVQVIDDEFLEWFVKNPSCDKVEIKQELGVCINCEWNHDSCPNSEECFKIKYKIIIPKEESKPESIQEFIEKHGITEQQLIEGYTQGLELIFENAFKEPRQTKPLSLVSEAVPLKGDYFRIDKINDRIHPLLHPNVETIESAIVDYISEKPERAREYGLVYSAIKFGIRLQQERSYSEEEVFKILLNYQNNYMFANNEVGLKHWFEQFKKK
jgi:hypothetical protein